MDTPANESKFVVCRCQNCDGGIEFDGCGFQKGETRNVECPHCHLDTIIFVPIQTDSPPPLTEPPAAKFAPPTAKTASPATALVLWAISGLSLLLCYGLMFASPDSDQSDTGFFVFLIFLGATVAAAIATEKYKARKHPYKHKPAEPKWICSNCGTLLISVAVASNNRVCRACGNNSVVPLGTPRGEELRATYHGAVTAKERVEIGDEANRRMLLNLDPAASSGGLAVQLEKLAGLVRIGAITHEEWQRAKALYLGHPKDKQADALARIHQLHGLCQSGALSASEFNTVKWDILAKGMAKGIG
jgi:hypothetical protein